ncbi:MAG: amidase [Pyrinomonadaceae bacterium]
MEQGSLERGIFFGSGAAVAAGLIAFAIGSETSGSIITPAAFCGVSGLRPTYGAVSRHGAMALSWTLDKLGPMCRSANCCGLVLAAIAGTDERDSTARRNYKFKYPMRRARARTNKLRFAVMKDSYEKAQPEVRDNFLRSLAALKKFSIVEMDVALPDFPYGPMVGTIVDAEGASAFRDLIESGRVGELASPEGRAGGYASILTSAVDYLHAMRLRAPARRAWAQMFAKYDLLVAPARATIAYPIDKTFDAAYPGISASSPIGASNLVGVPAISIPNGFGQFNLPTGIQLIGPAWGEQLVRGRRALSTVNGWHRQRPPETA